MRHSDRLAMLICLGAAALHGQAIIEYGISAGRAGAAGAAVGKSVTNTLGNLNKVLDTAAKSSDDLTPAARPQPATQTIGAISAVNTRPEATSAKPTPATVDF